MCDVCVVNGRLDLQTRGWCKGRNMGREKHCRRLSWTFLPMKNFSNGQVWHQSCCYWLSLSGCQWWFAESCWWYFSTSILNILLCSARHKLHHHIHYIHTKAKPQLHSSTFKGLSYYNSDHWQKQCPAMSSPSDYSILILLKVLAEVAQR